MFDLYSEELQITDLDSHNRTNITQRIQEIVGRSQIRTGFVIIQTKHTTTGLLVQEDEPGLMKDLNQLLEKLVPGGKHYYEHDDFAKRTVNMGPNERKNARSHLMAFFLKPSLTLIIRERQLELGKWQSIFFFDFDAKERSFRDVVVQVCGEK